MIVEVLYTHDTAHPPKWVGRTIHPALPQVVAEANDFERCRKRVRDGLAASGIQVRVEDEDHGVELVEWQGVKVGG